MCGIAGIIRSQSANEAPQAALAGELERLARGLAHRGPDARGILHTATVGLAHTRLSIIDLSPSGGQPMESPDGRFAIAYNGEAYNFRALRLELESKGERFVGTSDTEVVLRLLTREGPAALARLDGMFALALLDKQTSKILLARDRMGQKPLYWATTPNGGFAFASELLPLLATPGVGKRIDPVGLSHLLTFGVVPSPWTLRSGIRQLRPGTYLELGQGLDPREFRFSPEPGPIAPERSGDDRELVIALEDVLSRSVRDHLVADVPVGVLLSGGVDSSIIAALAARYAGRLKTYSVVHRDPSYDERSAALAVAKHIGSDHTEVEFSDTALSESELDLLVDHHGDPFADSSSLAVMRLARQMRRSVTVALSGDGGDEIFAGYPRFGQLRVIEQLARIPRAVRAALELGLMGAPGARPRQIARALKAASMPQPRRALAYKSLFWPEEQSRLLLPDWHVPAGALDALIEQRGAALVPDPISSAHWFEQRLNLPDDMLTKVDRMAMASSLEVRPPLLGTGVLDFAARMPFSAKHRGFRGKLALKAVARRLVPAHVVDRPKKGFALPLASHGGKVFDDAARFAIESTASPLRRLFRPEALRALSAEFSRSGEGGLPEDSPFRRIHRKWLLALLARSLARHGFDA